MRPGNIYIVTLIQVSQLRTRSLRTSSRDILAEEAIFDPLVAWVVAEDCWVEAVDRLGLLQRVENFLVAVEGDHRHLHPWEGVEEDHRPGFVAVPQHPVEVE